MIEDLSFSGLSNLIQGDTKIGKDAMIELSKRYISMKDEILAAEKKLQNLKNEHATLYGGVGRIMEHLKISFPLAIIIDKGLIVISEKTISVETNVL